MYYMLPLSIFCSSISIFLGQYRDHLDYDVLGRGDLWRRRRVAVDHEQGFFFLFFYDFSFFFTIFFLSSYNRSRTRWRASRLSSSRHQDSRSPSRLRRWTQHLSHIFLKKIFVFNDEVNSTPWFSFSSFYQNYSCCELNTLVFVFFFFSELYLLWTQHFGKLLLFLLLQWNCYRLLRTPTPWRTITYIVWNIILCYINSTKGCEHPLLGGLRPKQCNPSKQALSRQVRPLNII